MALLAGPIGENMINGRQLFADPVTCSEESWQALGLLEATKRRRVEGKDFDHELDRIVRQTRRIVRSRWPEIHRLAVELRVRGRMTFEHVSRFLSATCARRPR